MNNRFKFRVWDKRKNSYIKDFVFNFINKAPYITIEYFDNEYEYTHTFEEDEIIIEQCTGLKDKNGKLIYEGDICRIKGTYYDCDYAEYFDVDEVEKVESLEKFFGEAMVKGIYSALGCDNLGVEVIGNIHENADLLENEE